MTDVREHHRTFETMGTVVHLTLLGCSLEVSERATAGAAAAFRTWDGLFSRFTPTSELACLNASAGAWVHVSREMFDVLERCLAYADASQGAFDPSVGGLLAAQGYGLPEDFIPDERATYRDVELDRQGSRAKLAKGQALEPAALVKGAAIDAAAAALCDVPAWMINAGGDVLTHGCRPDDQPWHVAIQDPRDRRAVVSLLTVTDAAVATSGQYRRPGHLVDMRTRMPRQDLLSVTVVAPSAEVADALSTVASCLGLEDGRAYLERQHVPFVLVDAAGAIHAKP